MERPSPHTNTPPLFLSDSQTQDRIETVLFVLSWDRDLSDEEIVRRLRAGDDLIFSRFLKFGTWLDVLTFWDDPDEFRALFEQWLARRARGEKPAYNVPRKAVETWKTLVF